MLLEDNESLSMDSGGRDALIFIVCRWSCKQCEYILENCLEIVTVCWANDLVMRKSAQMMAYFVNMNIYIHAKCV